MRRTRLLAAVVFGAIVCFGVALFAQNAHPSEDYMKYCAKCHGPDGKGQTQRGKSLDARDFTDPEFQSSESDQELIEAVTDGKDDMPPFGKKLTKEQIESLVKNDVRGFAPKK